jgi:multidrug efflux pump subunit AcrA (membrane-fusion protein)
VKGAINYAIGDMDTATALTTLGKQKAEMDALQTLNDEWGPRGIIFSNIMIRGIEQDDASKALLSTTLEKMQEIENAKLALQQQLFDNQTILQQATAEARVNQLQNSTLTDLYVQDHILGQVHKLYLSSDDIMGMLNK